MKKKYYLSTSFLILVPFFIIGCSNENEKNESNETDKIEIEKIENIQGLVEKIEGNLVFQSRFEIGKDPADQSKVNPNPTRIANPDLQQPSIIGNEGFGTVSTDWEFNLEQKTPDKWNKFQLNYEQGTNNQRFAAIIDDPTKSNNRVMQFQINEANVFIPFPNSGPQYPDGQYKGRVSSEIFSSPSKTSNVKEYYQKIKIYIPKDFAALKASNRPAASDWLLLNEFRGGIPESNPKATSDQKKEFRVMVNLDKQTNSNNQNTDLYFKVIGEESINGWQHVWEKLDNTFPVPLGSWVETLIYIKEGKGTDGRVYFAVRPVNAQNNAPWSVLCDVNKSTVNSTNTTPSGYTSWCPMKLYCSKEIVDVFNSASKKLYVYWDDLEIYEGRKP